jgi:glycosyltransferase involved in cell wall biosynthesis
MNILIISAVFPPEPVVSAKLSFDIANALSEKNKVIVISPHPSRPFGFQFESKSISFNFDHIPIDSYICASSSILGRFRESYSFGRHCYRYIARNHQNINVIYANTWPLLGQYYVVKAAQQYKIPIILHVQDIYPESLTHKLPKSGYFLSLFLLPIDKYILSHSARILAISDQMKEFLAFTRKTEKEKIAVVQNWQDETDYIDYKLTHNPTINPNKPFTFMFLGNVGPVAGIQLLLDAFANANLQNSRLVIAGSGSMKKTFQEKVIEMNATSIEFWSVPEGKVPEIQDQADVMLLPVRKGAASSSMPSKLPAYMFSQKPIIACVDMDSYTGNVLRLSDSGWILPPEKTDSLVQLMKEIITIPKEVLLQKGRNGFEYALQNFSKKENLQKIISLINETSKV